MKTIDDMAIFITGNLRLNLATVISSTPDPDAAPIPNLRLLDLEARKDTFARHYQAWLKYIKADAHEHETIKISEKQSIQYVWPIGAPLIECKKGLVHKAFKQPIEEIRVKLAGGATDLPHGSGCRLYPEKGSVGQDPSGKEIYYAYTDPFTPHDLGQAEAFVMLGKTGAGKSTLLNAMINAYWGVNYDDKYRWKIIGDESRLIQEHEPGASMTFRVSSYYIAPLSSQKRPPLVIIDTPGFADTMARDDQIASELQKFFKDTSLNIKGIGFVMHANETRLTAELQIVIYSMLQFFGKDAIDNIWALFTFASAQQPLSLKLAEDEGIKTWFKFDN
jgi:GTP-binding protein EngB required for normal cell division